MSTSYDAQTGEWTVVGPDGQRLSSHPSEGAAQKWMANNPYKEEDNNDDNTAGEGEDKQFDWEGKFNLNLEELMKQYGVNEDLKKYFEGMEYDPQSEGFLNSLFNIEKEKTNLAKGALGRQKNSLMSGLDMNLDSIMGAGEGESYKQNQESAMRGQQIGGGRGGSFAGRFQTQASTQGIYGQQNQMMGQAEDKLGSLNDAMTNLDFEAQQSAISYEQDVYGNRQQWMDDFFDRLMQVEQMEES
jgi:hypothetical protein